MRWVIASVVVWSVGAKAQEDDAPGRAEARGGGAASTRKTGVYSSTRTRSEPHWPLVLFELGAVVTGRVNVFFGADLVAGVPLGNPVRASRKDRVASGWTVMPAIEASLGRLSGPLCAGARVCGERFVVGPALKLGHGVGVIQSDGVVRPVRMLYVQASAIGGVVDVPEAPLAPGEAWWEGGLRLRLGAHLGSLDLTGEGGFLSTFSLNLAAMFEHIAISRFTQGASFGGVVGIAF